MQPGQPMLRIADTEDLQIQVELPIRLVMGLTQGLVVPIQIDATANTDRINVGADFPVCRSTAAYGDNQTGASRWCTGRSWYVRHRDDS